MNKDGASDLISLVMHGHNKRFWVDFLVWESQKMVSESFKANVYVGLI